jgi:hypothetical protein
MMAAGRRDDVGFAGLSELAVAMLFVALLLPLVAIGLSNGYQFMTSLTARSSVTAGGGTLLAAAEQELQGAQPLGFCATPSGAVPPGAGSPADAATILETPVDDCPQPELGPPPPAGQADWGSDVSPLPAPSLSSCGHPALTAGALVTATATCLGFFSYDYQTSGSLGTDLGALSATGPLTPPELTYLWSCAGSCPGGTPAGTLWVTTYQPTGSYTNAGCPSPTAVCADPDWSDAPSQTRDVGPLSGGDAVLAYTGTGGDAIPLDPTLDPPALDPPDLADVLLVTVDATLSAPGTSLRTSLSVPVTGNVYQSATNGNG